LKKSGFHQRPPNRGQHNRRTNGKPDRPQGGQHGNPSSRASRAQAHQQWLDPSNSKMLTSHLTMTQKRRADAGGKKPFQKPEGNARYNNPRHRGPKDRNMNGRPWQENDRNANRNATPNSNRPPVPEETASIESAARTPAAEGSLVSGIKPFELFCAYHLGIQPNKQFRTSNINEVANRFNTSPAVIKQAAKEYGMDPASILDKDFDLAMAQLDIQVAPEGIDRVELAKSIYQNFLDAPIQKRNWSKILEEDQKENLKVFGR